jgi:hypothetical protein
LLGSKHKDVDARDKPGHDEFKSHVKTKKAPAKPGPFMFSADNNQRE